MPITTAQRFAGVVGIFLQHQLSRLPDLPTKASSASEDDASEGVGTSKKRNSKKAIQTRKAKYGSSKMKRRTVEKKRRKGHNIEKEDK